jgi:DNA adenine methylase
MSPVTSPLRYPGGKSRAISQIARYLPSHFDEYCEPFVGGGSVFVYLRQKFPHMPMWINDLNFDLFCFWKETQRDAAHLAARVRIIKEENPDGRVLFESLRSQLHTSISDLERAARFFVLNRISFSGTVDSGGYSEGAFHGRFTDSSIARLAKLGNVLYDVKITNCDYTDVIRAPGNDVFIFLDPPYLTATKSRLYGANGTLHLTFDHQSFAREMRRCQHQWLITYDNSKEIRDNFSFTHQFTWELQYGMNNYKRDFAPVGKELFLTNYQVEHLPIKQLALLETKTKYRARKKEKRQ